MKPLNKQQVLDLLKQGAKIRYTPWMGHPALIINDEVKHVHKGAFNALRRSGSIRVVAQQHFTEIWGLPKIQTGEESTNSSKPIVEGQK